MTKSKKKRWLPKSDSDLNKLDGARPTWTGKFFEPVVGERYRVPENSANYTTVRGMSGECTSVIETSFGHYWAEIAFDKLNARRTKSTSTKRIRVIRTSSLVLEATGEQPSVSPVNLDDATHPVDEKFAGVWQGESNSGTETLQGY